MPHRSPAQRAVTPQHRGRYPGFDVLDSVDSWDDVTAGAVLDRLRSSEALAFFSPAQAAIAGPLLDLLLNQDADPRVPVLELIDARLAAAETDGWHYDELPEDSRAWQETLTFLDQDAAAHGGPGFAHLSREEQAALVQEVQERGAAGRSWHNWPAKHVWSLWTRYACTAYYSHPWAWNEIGFPGPAYPRGYLNLGLNAREHWEFDDSGAEDSDADPVPFAGRVERARRNRAALLHRQEEGQ